MSDEFNSYKVSKLDDAHRLQVEELQKVNRNLERLIEIIERQGAVRPG